MYEAALRITAVSDLAISRMAVVRTTADSIEKQLSRHRLHIDQFPMTL